MIAFGDGENDLSMFSAVGTSVAMGNAQDTVKAAATYVTTAVDDDGIYNAAKHFGGSAAARHLARSFLPAAGTLPRVACRVALLAPRIL